MSSFAKEILKEMGEPIITPNTEAAAGITPGAEAKEGAEGGDPEGGKSAPGAQAPAPKGEEGATPKPGEEGAAKPGEEGKPPGEATPKPAESTAKPKPEGAAAEPRELDDAELLAALEKKGIKAVSLDALRAPAKAKTPEEEAAALQEEQENAIQYGLKNKSFKAEELNQYSLAAARAPRDIAMEEFSATYKSLNPDAKDEDIESAFADFFGENLEDGHFRKTFMQKEMQNIAKNYLGKKFPGIVGATDNYRAAVRVEQAARDYKDLVENTFKSVPTEMKFSLDNPDGTKTEYAYKVHADTMKSIKEQFLAPQQFAAFGQEAPDPEDLKNAISMAINTKDQHRMIETISKAHSDAILLSHQAGRKGVIPQQISGGSPEGGSGDTYEGYAKGIIQQTLNQ